MHNFHQQLLALSREWIDQGLPDRGEVIARGNALKQWRQTHNIHGLWSPPPRLMTATLDDGIGQGLEIIQLFSEAMGMAVTALGLVLPPEVILTACREQRPDYLGITVLQPDSEDELAEIGLHLPRETLLIAGGPAFRYDPQMAPRSGVGFVAANVAHFIEYALKDPRLTPRM